MNLKVGRVVAQDIVQDGETRADEGGESEQARRREINSAMRQRRPTEYLPLPRGNTSSVERVREKVGNWYTFPTFGAV
jgi:hypothetical protein